MSTVGSQEDPLAGWDPRRRAALERIRRQFKDAGGDQINLVDELLFERRMEAAAQDRARPDDEVVVEIRRGPEPAGE
jgi:predicted urease superfamily metal-dependent hydrolase